MKKTTAVLLSSLAMASANADVVGFSMGVQYWNHDMSGQVRSSLASDGHVPIDFSGNNNLRFFAALEHPLPFVPNIKLQQSGVEASGLIGVSDPSFLGGEIVYVRGDIDLSHTAVVLYYEVLDNWANLDLGLSVKHFDGYTRFKYQDVIDDESDFDNWIPMLYGRAQFDLPLTGLSAQATLEALSLDSNSVSEADVSLKYLFDSGFGVDLGYRHMDVDLKNINSFKSDLQSKGFYLGGHFEF